MEIKCSLVKLNWFSSWSGGEYGNHFEGDIAMTPEQLNAIKISSRNGIINTKYRWPNKTVTYRLSPHHSRRQNHMIEHAMQLLEFVSCVKFVERTDEMNYLQFTVSFHDFSFIKIHCQQVKIFRREILAVVQNLDTEIKYKYWIWVRSALYWEPWSTNCCTVRYCTSLRLKLKVIIPLIVISSGILPYAKFRWPRWLR